MKRLLLSLCAVCLLPLVARAVLVIPGADGSDGALLITANTEIDLSQAVAAPWNTSNAANAGKGVYDGTQWAVVFKYSSVTINAGATLTFKNHPSRAPVVWLVSGDVTIAGIVSLNGANGANAPLLAEPGPGGFRGGQGQLLAVTTDAGSGFGPGGAYAGASYDRPNPRIDGNVGYSGGYGTAGADSPSSIYGNPSLLPLLGGSGGGGDADQVNGGGAGGGAILIACANTLTVTGQIRANGGARGGQDAGGGSGGGIRLIASSLVGTGTLNAIGGDGWPGAGGLGRIRLERVVNNNTLVTTPSPSAIQLTAGATALLWPPATAPKVEVVSIGGNAAPADPLASFGSFGPDVVVGQVTSTPIVIRTTHVEQASLVRVRVTPRTSANYTEVTATVANVVSTDPLVINWSANLPVSAGHSAIQVRVVRP